MNLISKWLSSYQFWFLKKITYGLLFWDNLWPKIWPVISVIGFFLGVAFLGAFNELVFWEHISTLFIFLLVIGALLFRKKLDFTSIDEGKIIRKIEGDSRIVDRALSEENDQLLINSNNVISRSLWKAHKSSLKKKIQNLRVLLPKSNMATKDPIAIRYLMPIFLVISIFAAGDKLPKNFINAFTPVYIESNQDILVNVWIKPPVYSRGDPKVFEFKSKKAEIIKTAGPSAFLMSREDWSVPLLTGSELTIKTAGSKVSPIVKVGSRAIEMKPIKGEKVEVFQTKFNIRDNDKKAKEASINFDFGKKIFFPIQVQSDKPPKIEFSRAPSRVSRGQLKIEYEAKDDYGINTVNLIIRRLTDNSRSVSDKKIEEKLAIPLGKKSIYGSITRNFTSHPWAWWPVKVQLETFDHIGQVGVSEDIRIIFPERIFNHPVAQKLSEFKKGLSTFNYNSIKKVIHGLDKLSNKPNHFSEDISIFLGLRFAAARLRRGLAENEIEVIQKLLWDMAIVIEDGEYVLAERNLINIQREIMMKLNNNTSRKELKSLMEKMASAIGRYMQEMAKHLGKKFDGSFPADSISSDMLKNQLTKIQELAEIGSIDAARRLMAELQSALQRLRDSVQVQPENKGIEKVREMINGLKDILQAQKQLLDRTYEKERQRLDGGIGTSIQRTNQLSNDQEDKEGGMDLVNDQSKLRKKLKNLMSGPGQNLRSSGASIEKAQEQMKSAIKSLTATKTGNAIHHQGKAIESLRQSLKSANNELKKKFGQGNGMQGFSSGSMSKNGQLNRRLGNNQPIGVSHDNIKIPSNREIHKAHQLLKELRERFNDDKRSDTERKYIKRLLQQF